MLLALMCTGDFKKGYRGGPTSAVSGIIPKRECRQRHACGTPGPMVYVLVAPCATPTKMVYVWVAPCATSSVKKGHSFVKKGHYFVKNGLCVGCTLRNPPKNCLCFGSTLRNPKKNGLCFGCTLRNLKCKKRPLFCKQKLRFW